MDLAVDVDWLEYAGRLAAREIAAIELVVIHCTELPDLAAAREHAERIHYPESRTGNSGHFYIDRDGAIHQWVPADRVAHHIRGHNERSIGIELVNRGRYPHWYDSNHQAMSEPYTDAQIASLKWLLSHLEQALPNLVRVAGHDALDTEKIPAADNPAALIRRKLDPGPLFPWREIMAGRELEILR